MKQLTAFDFKLGMAFIGLIILALAISVTAAYGLNETIKTSRSIVDNYAQDLIISERLRAEEEALVSASRGYLITKNHSFLARENEALEKFLKDLNTLKSEDSPAEHRKLILAMETASGFYLKILNDFMSAHSDKSLKILAKAFEINLQPRHDAFQASVLNFVRYTKKQLEEQKVLINQTNEKFLNIFVAVSIFAITLSIWLAAFILRSSSRQLRRTQDAVKIREEVVETVAHDLKNPIAAIKLSNDLLLFSALKNGNLTLADVQKRNKNIDRALNRATAIINSLLDLTKLKNNSLTLEKKNVSLQGLLQEVFELFELATKEKNIQFELRQGDQLPSLFCDSERIIQVLSNLMNNAIKFSPAGSQITLGADPVGPDMVFYISDKGPGISEQEQKHIFDRYWQTDSSKKKGTGLGLAICRGIVDSHKGRIWVESSTRGSTFSFSIPRSKDKKIAGRSTELGMF